MKNEFIVLEKAILDCLNETLDFPIYLAIAPEGTKEPFGVLQTISTRAVRSIEYYHPRLQLDIYGRTPEKAVSYAENVCCILDGESFKGEISLLDSFTANRLTLIRVEDGTYKVPIDLTVNCVRKE